MDTSPNYFDVHDDSTREQYRRYGKRQSISSISPCLERSTSKFSGNRLLYDGNNFESRSNGALFIEEIKQESDNTDFDSLESTFSRKPYGSKRRISDDGLRESKVEGGFESIRQLSNSALKSYKLEDETVADGGDPTLCFASLVDSALQGLTPFPALILHFENACRNAYESLRYGFTGRYHRMVEDKLMRQKAQLLLDEAASWSLLWYLFGKENEELPENLCLSPATSHLEACQFVMEDHTAQLSLRIVQWLENLASKALDLEMKVRGPHVGNYLPSSGVWHQTQRLLRKGGSDVSAIQHLDFDAPTREVAHLLPEDKKQDESLLEDIWIFLRAGRLEEACDLCRSVGQPWRAATLCPFGGLDRTPSVEALMRNDKNRILQAIELESGIGHQWRLWKWACYCASERIAEQECGKYEAAVYAVQCSNLKRLLPLCTDWESACWAMAKSWLDVQVDLTVANLHQGNVEPFKSHENARSDSVDSDPPFQVIRGPKDWPFHVLDQQPRDLPALLQKLHSGDMVHETVSRGCKELHRQIEMNLMIGDIARLLDLLWSWVLPSEHENVFRPHGDPQIIRFGAHIVIVLRYLLAELKDTFKEKLTTIGDHILHMYAMYLFSKNHEELVGVYASQLIPHRCIDLFVHMMELRLTGSVHVKHKIFLSAIEYLPFSSGDDTKGCFEDIIERVLCRSREGKCSEYDEKLSNVLEKHRLQSLQKAMAVQWLCFTPPSTINGYDVIKAKLLARALTHSNILFREFALISMWRVPKMPVGAHTLLGFLAEPLKQPTDTLLSLEVHGITENMQEFHDWHEYFSCDGTYRNWLKIVIENEDISPDDISWEEKERANAAARETLNSSMHLLLRKQSCWMEILQKGFYDFKDRLFLELHATAMLCLPSGDFIFPDATACTTLTSALYSVVGEEDVLRRELSVNVAISSMDKHCIEISLRCLAVEGDGLGFCANYDGGFLASIMAAGFKGELPRFQAGVTMEISRLDAWYSNDGALKESATYVVCGLCRRCCLPEIILRCMQISVSLAESGEFPNDHDELINLVASPQSGLMHLFSPQQLQEFLAFEREYSIFKMEFTAGTDAVEFEHN